MKNSLFNIVVGIEVKLNSALSMRCPPGNWFAGPLLVDSLRQALESQGVTVSEAWGVGELADCVVVVTVSELDSSLQILKQRLHERELLESAEISYQDEAQDHWVFVHPFQQIAPSNRHLAPENLSRHQAKMNAVVARTLLMVQELEKQLQEGEAVLAGIKATPPPAPHGGLRRLLRRLGGKGN